MAVGAGSVSRGGSSWRKAALIWLAVSTVVVLGLMVWAAVAAGGNPNPTAGHISRGAAVVGAGILVFREGLETILVLAAITASMVGANRPQRKPIAVGASLGFAAAVGTWFVVVAIISSVNAPELKMQAATGWVAVVVLILVMNWFFHKVYWTGWIQVQNRHKRHLLQLPGDAHRKLLLGLGLLGFASIYREGFEVVLFLQTLRLATGTTTVLEGSLVGLYLTGTVGALTFLLHHRLPYRKMLVATGALLTLVLLVMVGEEINEMQLAHWMAITTLPGNPVWPGWLGTWFSLFPNWETLVAMALALMVVGGSYVLATYLRVTRPRRRGEAEAVRLEDAPRQGVPGEGVLSQ